MGQEVRFFFLIAALLIKTVVDAVAVHMNFLGAWKGYPSSIVMGVAVK